MNKSKHCEMCNLDFDKTWKYRNLCFYHYWIAKGKIKSKTWFYRWLNYKDLHPVRVSRWCKMDCDLNSFLNEEKSNGDTF